MKRPIKIVLVGIGGYGNTYVSELLDTPRKGEFEIAGAVDPAPQSCRRLEELKGRGVLIFPSLEEFYASQSADLAVISAPIHLHAPLMQLAVWRGSHVLCEKPLCATPEDAARMAEAQKQSGRIVSVGYQWSFSVAVLALKRDVEMGLFGKAMRLKSLVLWPRDREYYHRNSWAGAVKDGNGNWVLDSPVNNAAAHYLHNMLYVVGGSPAKVEAELFRIHPIANYDTAVARCVTDRGVEIFFVTSHATAERNGPHFRFEFEKAIVSFSDGGNIAARFLDGSVKDYGSPDAERTRPLWQTIDAIGNGGSSVCGVAEATPHVQCNWAIQHSVAKIAPIPPGRDADLARCYEQWRLPGELGLSWGRA